MTYLFLDTNIYLHYNDYEQIKWKDYITDIGEFSIVVPGIVRQEINKQKDKANSKIKNKAIRLISRLKNISLYGGTSEIPLLIYGYPPADSYDGIKFRRDCQDDTVILSVLDFKKDYPDDRIILIAADFDVLLKAKENGIEFLELPASEKLGNELSEEEKKIKELEQQVALYKNRLPELEISFQNGERLLKLKRPDTPDIDKLIEAKVKEEKERHPILLVVQEDHINYLESQILNTVSNADIRRYNGELQDYFKEYENYIRKKLTWEVISQGLETIIIKVTNIGTLKADKIYCTFKFPDNIFLYDRKNVSVEKVVKPILSQSPNGSHAINQNRKLMISFAEAEGTRYENIECYDLSYSYAQKIYDKSISDLEHCFEWIISFKDDFFIDTRTCKNFKIEYTFIVSNLPKPITGDLNVVFE